jgi:hypothetical protein
MDYEIKTYGTAQFYVQEGMYSIEQLEQLLANFKEAKAIQDRHLQQSLQPIKEQKS